MRGLRLLAILSCALLPAAHAAPAPKEARRVVVLVWDGLRPDSVTPENTPALHGLAAGGVTFRRHNPAYPSTTQVNGTAIATGSLPQRSGIIANSEYRPAINLSTAIRTDDLDAIRKTDELSNNRYLRMATTAEILRAAGKRTAVAGTKAVALLHDRFDREGSAGAVVFGGKALPAATLAALESALGPFPAERADSTREANLAQDLWTTRAMLEVLWQPAVPDYSLLWLSEPDLSQHGSGPGSPTALAALRSSDDNLRRVLGELERRGLRDTTDVLVVSDHGFSTVSQMHDTEKELRDAGFPATRKRLGPPEPGGILVVGNGGSVFFYVSGSREADVLNLVRWLQSTEWAGVILTRRAAPGTLTLADANIASEDAPDIVVSMRGSGEPSSTGVPGLLHSDARKPGDGMHGSLNAADMRNTLIAAGPSFPSGVETAVPSGNIDIAPTVLAILGVDPPEPQDGRALLDASPQFTEGEKSAEIRVDGKLRRQTLKTAAVAGTVYIEEGAVEWLAPEAQE